MHSPERLKYLNRHRVSGDITEVANQLGLSTSTVYDIVTGKFYGNHAEKVLQKLEEMIDSRVNQVKIMAEKYNKKISDSL